MANIEHLRILDSSVLNWNSWRKENPDCIADLSGACLDHRDFYKIDLHGVNLEGANLFQADLTDADLRGANLRGADLRASKLRRVKLGQANLQKADLRDVGFWGMDLNGVVLQEARLDRAKMSGVDLQGVNLQGADLQMADLSLANLEGADLQRADLQRADLQRANLGNANLSEARLQETNLSMANLFSARLVKVKMQGAILRGAYLEETSFSSRATLNDLGVLLTDEQLAGAIFEDEQEFYAKDRHEAPPNAPTLCVRFDDDKPWDAARFGIFFATLHTAYARLFYLATTEEEDEAAILRVLDRKGYHLSPEQDICLHSVSTGSLWVEFVTYLSEPANLNAAANAAKNVLQGLGTFLAGFAAMLLVLPTIQEKRANTEAKRLEIERLRRERGKEDQPEASPAVRNDFGCPPVHEAKENRSLAQQALEGMDLKQVVLVLEPRSSTVRDNPQLVEIAARELSLSLADLAKLGKTPTVVKSDKPDDRQAPNT